MLERSIRKLNIKKKNGINRIKINELSNYEITIIINMIIVIVIKFKYKFKYYHL
jgi:hypothetical protein